MRTELEAAAWTASNELQMASRGLMTIGELIGEGSEHHLTEDDIEGLLNAVHAIGVMVGQYAHKLGTLVDDKGTLPNR